MVENKERIVSFRLVCFHAGKFVVSKVKKNQLCITDEWYRKLFEGGFYLPKHIE